jgi:hypothetical protein
VWEGGPTGTTTAGPGHSTTIDYQVNNSFEQLPARVPTNLWHLLKADLEVRPDVYAAFTLTRDTQAQSSRRPCWPYAGDGTFTVTYYAQASQPRIAC